MADEPGSVPYLDTSALAKRYLDEPGSTEFESYLCEFSWAAISTLTLVEMHCLLARRRRYQELTSEQERRVREALKEDVDLGDLRLLPVADHHLQLALRLLDSLEQHALRTLDAIHLALIQSAGHRVLATADLKMASAAADLGLEVWQFS